MGLRKGYEIEYAGEDDVPGFLTLDEARRHATDKIRGVRMTGDPDTNGGLMLYDQQGNQVGAIHTAYFTQQELTKIKKEKDKADKKKETD